MEPKGKKMLKVVGILYIVFSGLSIVGGLLLLLGGGVFLAGGMASEAYLGAGIGGLVMFTGVILVLSSALGLVAGILAVKYCARPEKAQTCFVFGIILIVVAAISMVTSLVAGTGNVLSGAISLALPILYTVGASQNKQPMGQ